MSGTGYLYWNENITDCKFQWKNRYCRGTTKHENGNGKKENMQKENRCMEVAKEHPNHNKHPNAIKKIISEIIRILLIMWAF